MESNRTVVTGAGAASSPTAELVVTEGAEVGRRFAVEGELVLGRESSEATIVDPEVSRRHAVVRRGGPAALEIEDLGSRNGTFVNGAAIEGRHALEGGDMVTIGQTSLRVETARTHETLVSPGRLVFRGGPLEGSRFPVRQEVVLGRDSGDIVVEDPEVSRRHAAVRPVPGGLEIRDLGSSNGTYVDGRRIDAPKVLRGGERIHIGQTAIEVQLPERAQRTVATGSS